MTRIIAGKAGGRRLSGPKGPGTRPTTDRVREALFSSLESMVGSLEGLRFLDLYAGTGAVGLEAWSRGAGAITFVEGDRNTAALIATNAAAIGCRRIDVRAQPVARIVANHPSAAYDVIFADPPYDLAATELDEALASLIAHCWAVPGALLILERSVRAPAPQWPAECEQIAARKYGETMLHIGRYAPQRPEASLG